MNLIYGLLLFFILVPFTYPSETENISEEKKISFGIESDFASQYIWRGISYNKGFLVQPSPWISYANFTLSLWGNLPAHDVNSSEGNEIDFTVSYLEEFEEVSFEPSFNYYTYPGQEEAPATGEGNLKISYKILEAEVYTNLTLDVLKYSGSFASDFGITREFELSEKLNLSLDLSAGGGNKKFNQTYINPESGQNSLNYFAASFSANYYLNEIIYIKPHVENFFITSADLKQISGNTLWNFGVIMGIEL